MMGASLGKTVANRLYVHTFAIDALADDLMQALPSAEEIARVRRPEDYNVIRFDPTAEQVALLSYPGFFDDPFPELRESWRVDLTTGGVGHRTYVDSLNPPILHRKELLLPQDHPRRAEFAALTQACETVGLFDQPTRIGYRRQWEQLVREKGYRIVGHALVPIGNDESAEQEPGEESLP